MIGWLIVLGILALLLGLLLSPLVFALDYDDPKDRFFWKLSWLGIPLLSSEGKGVFRKKTGKPEKKERRKEPETEEKPEHTDKKGKLKRYWKSHRTAFLCCRNRCGVCGKGCRSGI